MIIKKDEILNGKNNKRLHASKKTNNEGTAAWQNMNSTNKEDGVNKPSIQNVVDAKDWVDNGSRL